MEIKDLQARQGNVDVIVEVLSKDEPREFEKFGSQGKVCNAKAKDQSGEITLTLWNEDIDKVNVGDKVHLTNGWVSEWQGELQLSTGKFGKMEIVEGTEGKTEEIATKDEKEEADVLEGQKTDLGEKILSEDEKTEEETEEKTKEPSLEKSQTKDEKIGVEEEDIV